MMDKEAKMHTRELYSLIQKGEKQAVRTYMEEHNMTPESYNKCLHRACKIGQLEIVKRLVEDHGVDVNSKDGKNSTPLYHAIEQNHAHLIKYLITSGSSVNDQMEPTSSTALHESVNYCKTSIVKYILSKGADVNARDAGGHTPLCSAALLGRGMSCRKACVLLEAGADVHVRDAEGRTPFILAAQNQDVKLMYLLLSKGADPNVVDDNGDSALHLAIDIDMKFATIEYLVVDVGIDCLNLKNAEGDTPLSLALDHSGNFMVFEVLVNYGCNIEKDLLTFDDEYKPMLLQRWEDGKEFFELLKRIASPPRSLKDLACIKIRRILGDRLDGSLKHLSLPEMCKCLVMPPRIAMMCGF